VGEITAANRPRIEALNAAWDVTIPAATMIACRRAHAYSLFNNLISNALDAVADCAKRRITITAHSSSGRVTVRIADTGPGVPDADRKRIFNAFYSTKPQSGTGLGLAIAKRIVELYDGNLTVTANDAGGATFVVGLPAAAAEHIDKEPKSIGTDG
jgi:signal transduction histidine kinase